MSNSNNNNNNNNKDTSSSTNNLQLDNSLIPSVSDDTGITSMHNESNNNPSLPLPLPLPPSNSTTTVTTGNSRNNSTAGVYIAKFPPNTTVKTFTDERMTIQEAVDFLISYGFNPETSQQAISITLELPKAYDMLHQKVKAYDEYNNAINSIWKSPISVRVGE